MADYRFKATDLEQEDYIIVELPNKKSVCINRTDVGYSVDFMNENEEIIECGIVLDEDLELEKTDEEWLKEYNLDI